VKSKKSVYILIPIVVIVWGLIAYKIIVGMNAGDDNLTFTADTNNHFINNMEADTFSLILAYRDPFLGKNLYQQQESNVWNNEDNNQKKKQTELIKQPVTISWPGVAYLGLILNKKTGIYVSLIKIDNKEHLLLEGQEAKGIKVLKANKDSVIVQFQKEIKTFKK
jgi:hypothetical protein